MKLSCPSCGAKYSIADEKVQDRLAKIRCRKCSATIIVDGKVEPPSVYTSDAGAPAASEYADGGTGAVATGEYSVDFGDNDQRSMTADDIVQAYRRGELTADTYVWSEGMSDWQPIGSVPELAEALSAGASAAAAPRAAARAAAGRGSAHDLFGGIDKAGSEEDVMTSAPQPAAAPAAVAATGARNESSVLFSLSALTASAPVAPAPRSSVSTTSASSAAKGDDSGLIDLKALTSAAGSQPPPGALSLGAPLGMGAPLGLSAPLGGMTAPAIPIDGPPPRAGNKTGLYIGGALVIFGALIAGAIVMTFGKQEAPLAAVPAALPATPTPPAAAAPAPEAKKDEPTAQPPATGTAEPATPPAEAAKEAPTKQASTPKAVAMRSTATRAKSSSSTSSSSSSSSSSEKAEKTAEKAPAPAAKSDDSDAPKKPAKKKEKTCNCGAGNLMCAMKCAAS